MKRDYSCLHVGAAILFVSAANAFSATALQINANGQQITRSCEDRSVQVSGNNDSVRLIGHCRSLQVSGNHNSIRVDRVDSIQTSGLANSIHWLNGDPSVQDTGKSNVFNLANQNASRTGNDSSNEKSDSESTTSAAVLGGSVGAAVAAATQTAAGVAGSVTVEQTDASSVNLVMSNQRITRDCKDGKNVNINGYEDDITLVGSCGTVSMNGWGNHVHIKEAEQISISGHTNTVTWERARTGDRPKVNILNGFDNRVRQGD